MNWRDSIWAQTRSRGRRSRCVKLATQRLVPYSENKGYASNPRRFVLLLGLFALLPGTWIMIVDYSY